MRDDWEICILQYVTFSIHSWQDACILKSVRSKRLYYVMEVFWKYWVPPWESHIHIDVQQGCSCNHITFKLSFLCYHHIHSIHLILRRNGILHTYQLAYYWLQYHIPNIVFRYGRALLILFYYSKTSTCFQINIHEV